MFSFVVLVGKDKVWSSNLLFSSCHGFSVLFTAGNIFLVLNFRHVLNVIFFLLGDSLASDFYVLTFWNTVGSSFIGDVRWNRQIVPKRWLIKFRHWGITQKKEYNM